jgi:hypothetical protein
LEYLNLTITSFQRPEYLFSEPIARATWLNLITWCARVENSGRIEDCRAWTNRQWQQVCGVTLKEVNRICDLWSWEGDDLVVWAFPVEQQEVVIRRRQTAKENGRAGGRPPKNKTHEEPTSVSDDEPISESVKEGKEREGNEREGNEKKAAGAYAPSPPPVQSLPPRVAEGLAAMWPDAPRLLDSSEKREFQLVARVLGELTEEDWKGLSAWVKASNRSRDQRALWPRDRVEFLRNVSEVVSKVRPWWRKEQRPAPVAVKAPVAPSTSEDDELVTDPEEIRRLLRAPL